MDEEQDFEPTHDEEEKETVAFDVSGDDLFGDPNIPPSLYHCAGCAADVLARDVVWDWEDKPHCPQCNRPLARRAATATG